MLQEKNINKNKIMKHPEGNRVFIGCLRGELYEYLINEKRISHDFCQILDDDIFSMATTFDNKYLFLCTAISGFREINIRTHKQVNKTGVENVWKCVVTYDNRFLITSTARENPKLTKWSIQTKQQLHTWNSNVDEYVIS